MTLNPLRAFADAWRAIEAMRDPEPRSSARAILYLYVAALMTILTIWVGHRGFYHDVLATLIPPKGEWPGLYADLYWALSCVVYWGVIPAIVVKATGGSLRAHGLSPRGFVRHLPVYALLFLAVSPAVFIASARESFTHTYPLSGDAARAWTPLLIFEAAYALQFLALEFFFRGFLLFGLVRRLGALVIPVMVVPYGLIHFGKPLPEALGAIVAGTILGTLALRTGSIWGGVAIHYAVALSMDLLALWRKGAFLFT